MIRRIPNDSDGTYGMPRVHAQWVQGGCHVGRKRVARLMRESGLVGVSRRRGTRTTRVERNHRAAPDRVERECRGDAPDKLRVADITFVPTWAGFVYLAIVLDVFSRKVVGWAMANQLRTELVRVPRPRGDEPGSREVDKVPYSCSPPTLIVRSRFW